MAPRKTHKTIEKVEGVYTPPEFVILRHPAQGTGVESVLFRVPAYSESGTVKGYVPYELLWLAGVIISDNRTEGYLTRGTAPNEQIVDPGTCLRPGNYYFQVGSRDATEPENYALLRGIQQWKLKEEMIPQAWKDAASWVGREVSHRENTCIVTGANDKVQSAHLVPAALHQWLLAQEMLQHAINSRVIRGRETLNSSNMVRLYAPLHAMLDDGSWVFFPFPETSEGGRWRYHCVWVRRNDTMANWYHCRPVRGGCEDVTEHAMIARFAYNVFMCMQTDHLALDRDRYLRNDEGTNQVTSHDEVDEWLEENRTSTDPKRRSKSRSPTKPKRSWSTTQQDPVEEGSNEKVWSSDRSSTSSTASRTSLWDQYNDEEDAEGGHLKADGKIGWFGRGAERTDCGGSSKENGKRGWDESDDMVVASVEQIDDQARVTKRIKL